MAKNTKTVWGMYSAWNYEKEIEDLNKRSEQGWQLVKGGLLHNKFRKNPNVRWRYQLDYRDVEEKGRYIETFREQGWEYINSTFNHWHYFRKAYDPALPEEAYEIFTDRESLREMNKSWVRMALIAIVLLAGFAVSRGIEMITRPRLPVLAQLLAFLLEIALLLRGVLIMRNPEASRNRRHDSAILTAILAVALRGAAAAIPLTVLRPSLSTEQRLDAVEAPIVDNRWVDFTVKYPDNYFLDLELEAEKPMTFAIYNEAGEAVYTCTESSFQQKDIRLRLEPGTYQYSMSCETGFHVAANID